MKNNTNYFSHDCNARDDEKIMLLRSEYWWEWYGIFWLMIEKLSEATEYKLLLTNKLVISKLYQANIEVINYLFELWLLEEQGEYMYSPSLLYRMQLKLEKKLKQSEWWKKAMLSRWKNKSDSETDKLLITSKVKESKVKENKEYNLLSIIETWNKIKWFKSTRKITEEIKKQRSKVMKDYTIDEFELAVNNYYEDTINRTKTNDPKWYDKHRFTFYEFIKQDNWLQKWINK